MSSENNKPIADENGTDSIATMISRIYGDADVPDNPEINASLFRFLAGRALDTSKK